jgi:hypothetical protein
MKLNNIIIYAPNIYSGGGKVLLDELIISIIDQDNVLFFLDERYVNNFNIDKIVIKNNLLSRIYSEFLLYAHSNSSSLIFILNSIPPLLKLRGYVVLYHQNILLISKNIFKSSFKSMLLKIYSRFFSFHIDEYVVQTNVMLEQLKKWYSSLLFRNKSIKFSVFLFYPQTNIRNLEYIKKYDFIYVADASPHKNHSILLDSWVILSKRGIYPSLALTIDSNKILTDLVNQYNLKIFFLGKVPHNSIDIFYSSSSALIYPSLNESLGLPLIEAHNRNIPIVASELDYVREICSPVETFNPCSSNSIASAVQRFLDINMSKPTNSKFQTLLFKYIHEDTNI